MSTHSLSLFVHIVGALALFASIGLEQASLRNLRRAGTVAQAREWVRLWKGLPRVDGPAGLTVLASGIYLAVNSHVHDLWIAVSLLGMVAMAVIGGAVTRRRVAAIATRLTADDRPIPRELRARLDDPALRTAAALRLAIAVAIVFEMTVKPGALAALAAMALAPLAAAALARTPRGEPSLTTSTS